MKKTLLSSMIVLVFAGYALYTRIVGTSVSVTPTLQPNKPKNTLILPTYTPAPPSQTASNPPKAPNPTPSPSPAPVNTGKYKNGSYTGPVVDAYYGNVQVKVVISGGKITDVQFLDYPHDRQTSRYINSQAMPYLISEAISAQSANVDGVSGASFTSAAFKKSLASALVQAKV